MMEDKALKSILMFDSEAKYDNLTRTLTFQKLLSIHPVFISAFVIICIHVLLVFNLFSKCVFLFKKVVCIYLKSDLLYIIHF